MSPRDFVFGIFLGIMTEQVVRTIRRIRRHKKEREALKRAKLS